MYLVPDWIPLPVQNLKPSGVYWVHALSKVLWNSQGRGFYYVNPFLHSVNPAANTRLWSNGRHQREKELLFQEASTATGFRQENFLVNYDVKITLCRTMQSEILSRLESPLCGE